MGNASQKENMNPNPDYLQPLNYPTLKDHLSDYGLRLHTGLKFRDGDNTIVSIQAIGDKGTAVMSCTVINSVVTDKMSCDAFLRVMPLFEREALDRYYWEAKTL